MSETCDPHSGCNIEWDWGDTRPADDYVAVPGRCHDCGTEYERRYVFHGNFKQ